MKHIKLNKNTLRQVVLSTLFVFGFSLMSYAQNVIENLEIGATEVVKINANTTIKNLIVNADKNNCGQLNIESGVVSVEKMTYRLTLAKDDWTMVAFPSNIPHVLEAEYTNFTALGYKQNLGLDRYFQLKYFNDEEGMSERDAWKILTDKNVVGGKAYQLLISGSKITEPEAIDFYFNNLHFDSGMINTHAVVDLNLAGKPTKQTYPVTISTLNASSNELTVEVYNDLAFAPSPIDYDAAIAESKFIFTEENDAFRVVLPNDEVCRLLIMDKKMKKVVEAIEYVSPAAIPTADLKRGKYKVVMQYGGSTGVKDLQIAK